MFMSSHSFRLALLSCVLAVPVCFQGQTQRKQTPKAASQENQNPLISGFKAFSAKVSGGIAKDHDRNIYRAGNLMRLDFDESYRVTDLSTLKMWGVTGKSCIAFERPDAGTYPWFAFHDFKVERVSAKEKEEETVDGHVCKIETLIFNPPDERPVRIKMQLWEAEDLDGFPIKIEVDVNNVDGSNNEKIISTYTDVSLTAPDPKLFRHPAKCQANTAQLPNQKDKKTGGPAAPKKDSTLPKNRQP
jgi:hypothetical protein